MLLAILQERLTLFFLFFFSDRREREGDHSFVDKLGWSCSVGPEETCTEELSCVEGQKPRVV